jgi:hypothetical protein
MDRKQGWWLPFGLFLVTQLYGSHAAAQQATQDQRQSTLDQVLALAQERALDAGHVDWAQARKHAQQLLDASPDDAGLTRAIRSIIGPLGGGHSHYQPPSEQSRGTPFSSSAAPSQLLPIAETWRTSNGTPGLALHRWAGDKTVAAAGDARRALHAAMAEPSCGLMIDLRGNTGGNLWPMLFGVSPLLPQGKIGGFQKRSGEHADILNLPTGNRIGRQWMLPRIEIPAPAHLPRHIAILQDRKTASSGEILLILFKTQDHVRYFGQPSRGFPTANTPFPLKNGGRLDLTTAVTLDRAGRAYTGPLLPDLTTDDAVGAAEAWLSEQCQSGTTPTS